MKKNITLILTLSILVSIVLILSGCLQPIKEQDLSSKFTDPNLLSFIRTTINKPSGPIYQSNLLPIKSLQYNSNNKISSLEGIQYCKNLEDLEILNSDISDISPLASLTNLTILGLRNNKIVDIKPIERLTKLQTLALSYNKITDLSPIKDLSNIQNLFIGNNPIPKSNWAFIKTWTWLKQLGLDNMNLQDSDITFLSNFSNLEILYVSDNQISDLSPLQNLIKLIGLYADNNQISDVLPLQKLTKLINLNLSYNNIADISSLVDNTGLGSGDYLYITHNNLDLTEGSDDMNNINTLIDRGVYVYY